MDEKVTVVEEGRRRTVTKRQAIAAQLVNRSAQADLKAIQILMGMLQNIERRGEPASPESFPFSDDDADVINSIKARLMGDKERRDD